MRANPSVSVDMPAADCHHCAVSHLCLPVSLSDTEIDDLDQIIKRNHPLQRSEHLFRAGDPLKSFFAIRSGSLKTYTISSSGEEQITGFHLPGELVGLDGMRDQRHVSYACALETSMICTLPSEQLDTLTARIPSLRKQLWKVMSQEIFAEQQLLALLNKRNAEGRVASFLLNLSVRFANRGRSARSFLLPMARGDIGNYLGLEIETVSRVLATLRKNSVIELTGREVTLLNRERLDELANLGLHDK